MIYAPEDVERLVVVDTAARRFYLVVPIPLASGGALVDAVVAYVRFRARKAAVKSDPGKFDPKSIVPDAEGWYAIP